MREEDRLGQSFKEVLRAAIGAQIGRVTTATTETIGAITNDIEELIFTINHLYRNAFNDDLYLRLRQDQKDAFRAIVIDTSDPSDRWNRAVRLLRDNGIDSGILEEG